MRFSFQEIVNLLKQGGVAALPTETVYGLAACLDCPPAVEQIFALKKRPAGNPLIIHCASVEQMRKFLPNVPPYFDALASAFWPGPMTLVLPVETANVPPRVRAGLPTAAFRIPEHPIARRFIEAAGPLVMPSANLSGRPSATAPEHVEQDFGHAFPLYDGGSCSKGVESTILYWEEEWRIGRLGALPPAAFVPILGKEPSLPLVHSKTPICPGQLYRHYAPQAALILLEEFPSDLEGTLVGFEERSYPEKCRLLSLGHAADPEGAAQRLYALLRQLDAQGITRAYVDMRLPDHGLWLTFKERLRKAAVRS
jgi:L-threonylcarbamoyladenylate synthase